MERKENLLTAKEVASAGEGWRSDGGNLYLRVDHSPDGGKRRRWIVRVTRDGVKRDFGVGGEDKVSLALARRRRDEILKMLKDGLDPVAEKKRLRAEARQKKAAQHTFGEAAQAVFKNLEPSWRQGSSTPAQWVKSINKDCARLLKMPVGEIGVDEVKAVVQPFWERDNLVAGRALLARIKKVLAYATAHGWRKGDLWRKDDNPASWEVFQHLFPRRKNGGVRHHPMVKWEEMPAFMAKLRAAQLGDSALALELIALTATRSKETRGMRFGEIDWDKKLWTVPPGRMKKRGDEEVEFKVPLSEQALDLLKTLNDEARGKSQLVFPGPRSGSWIAHQTLWTTMQRVTDKTASPHGLRASFRSWAADHGVPNDLGEACLAHGKKNAVEQAYNRADYVARRRVVMQDWADFLDGKTSAKVVSIGAARVPPSR